MLSEQERCNCTYQETKPLMAGGRGHLFSFPLTSRNIPRSPGGRRPTVGGRRELAVCGEFSDTTDKRQTCPPKAETCFYIRSRPLLPPGGQEYKPACNNRPVSCKPGTGYKIIKIKIRFNTAGHSASYCVTASQLLLLIFL